MAPEIVQKLEFCGPPADVYASGVLLFAFFCGCFPFRGQNDKELYKKIATADLVLPDHIPSGPRYLLKYMLKKTAEERPTTVDLLQDPWVQSGLVAVKEQQSFTITSSSSRANARSSQAKLVTKRMSSTISPVNNQKGQQVTISPISNTTSPQLQLQQQRPFHPLANQASKPQIRTSPVHTIQFVKPVGSYYTNRAPPQTAQGQRNYALGIQKSSKLIPAATNAGLPPNSEVF